MNKHEILLLIKKLDCTSNTEQEVYWQEIKKLKIDIPEYFLEAYPKFTKWQGRVHLVFRCIKYARMSEQAFQLGVCAISDKSSLVRYRGACILAYSLRKDALPYLQENLIHPDQETRNDAGRAIEAIINHNHHIFMKHRAHQWIVNPEIDEVRNFSLVQKIKNIFINK